MTVGLTWIAYINQGPLRKTETIVGFRYKEFNIENLVTPVKEFLRSQMEEWGYSEISSCWRSLLLPWGWSSDGGAGVFRTSDPVCEPGGARTVVRDTWWKWAPCRESGPRWEAEWGEDSWAFPLLFEISLLPALPKAVWKSVDKRTNIVACDIFRTEKRSKGKHLDQHTALAVSPSLSQTFLKGIYLFFFLKKAVLALQCKRL